MFLDSRILAFLSRSNHVFFDKLSLFNHLVAEDAEEVDVLPSFRTISLRWPL